MTNSVYVKQDIESLIIHPMKYSSSFQSLCVCLFCILLLQSCKDDYEIPGPQITEENDHLLDEQLVDLTLYAPDQIEILGSVTGLITDENEQAVEGAIIKLANEEYQTNSDGRFIVSNVSLNAAGQTYTVHKDGYFKGVRRFYPKENAISQTTVQLIAKSVIGTFEAKEGASVSTIDGLTVTFPSDAIVNSIGDLVEGQVEVAAYWIDPSAPSANHQLPGSLVGLNRDIEEMALTSYSMAAIELSANGEEVNIAPGQKATINFPIAESFAESAPNEIALWSLEEKLGIWVEEGVAIKQGNEYVGTVSHFSFWTCGFPLNTVEVYGSIQNSEGLAIPGVLMHYTVDPHLSGWQMADSNGNFGGLMPSNEVITIEFKNGDCDSHTVQIGPFSNETIIDPITLPFQVSQVRGQVQSCEGEAMSNQTVLVGFGDRQTMIACESDGSFERIVPHCETASDEFYAITYDVENNVQSSVVFLPQNDILDFGVLSTCDETKESFLRIFEDGILMDDFDSVSFHTPIDDPTKYAISRLASLGDKRNVFLIFPKIDLGSETSIPIAELKYMDIAFDPVTGDPSFSTLFSCNNCTEFELTFSEFNLIGNSSSSNTVIPGSVFAGDIIGHLPDGTLVEVSFARYF